MEEAIRRAGLLVPRLQETGRKLGEGSYGEVVEVKVEGRLYAGKRLHAFFTRGDVPPEEKGAISKRFEEECLRLPRLKHPNIMQVVGVYFHPSTRQPTLVMELLHTSLSEYLETHPGTPPHVKHSILLDVARGLQYLHTLPPPLGPIVHRDLTANNVLLTSMTSNMMAKIADLGQARIIDKSPAQLAQSKRWTKCPGNVAHMPPEALLDTPTYDAALDVFSFGVVMLHTLTQEWPEPSANHVLGPGGYRLVKEVERRRRYLDKIDNPLLKPLVIQCLNDTAELRLSAGDLVGALGMLMSLQQTVQQKTKENQVLHERLNQEINENQVLQQKLSQERKESLCLHQELEKKQQQYEQLSREMQEQEHLLHQEEMKERMETGRGGGTLMHDTVTTRDPEEPSTDPPPRCKMGDRVVIFDKKGRGIRGTVRWTGKYGYRDDKKYHTFNAVGIETDVRVFDSELESYLAPKSHAFSVGKGKGQVFVREEEAMLEKDYVVPQTQAAAKPQQPKPGGTTQAPLQQPPKDGMAGGPRVRRQPSNTYEPIPGPREPLPQQYAEGVYPAVSQSQVPLSVVGLPQAKGIVPTPPPTADPRLEEGSMVEVTTTAVSLYGVIRWIGNLPNAPYRIAGMELEEDLEGCTDGTWQGTGEQFFHCPTGRGFFCPLYSLKPDTRFEQPEQHQPGAAGMAIANPLNHIPLEEVADQGFGSSTIPSVDKYAQPERGIQGHQNSCYLDATVFGLFALSDVFDSLFLEKSTDEVEENVKNTLWRGIVNPLRKNGAVRYESVMKLREQLDRLGKMKGIAQDEKDPEEFLNMLFKHTLHVQPFITIQRPQGEEEEFFVQLFMEPFEGPRLPSIEDLLRRMFKDQNIKFAQVPSKLLIQVPRYGKQFKAFKKIIPNLCLNIGDLCASSASLKERDAVVELELLSVICIETSHYVCFTHYEGHWVFMDSMADRLYNTYNIPKGVDVTRDLNEWVYSGDENRLKQTPVRKLPEYVRRFTQDIYMCVYIQPDYGMYQ